MAVAFLMSGCAALGVRPSPKEAAVHQTACRRYVDMYNYTLDLREAYHSRASGNRFSIYLAGTIALGTAAATAGLGAAGAAGLTIALLGISGGFTSGFFALVNNSELANVYTDAANQLSEGLKLAEADLKYATNCPTISVIGPDGEPESYVACLDEQSCKAATVTLELSLTKAETELELARSNSAAGAVVRAQAEVKRLQDSQLQTILTGAKVTKATWDDDGKAATATVSGDLSKVTLDMFKVRVGSVPVDPTQLKKSEGTYEVGFVPPEEPADTPDKGREVAIVFPSAGVTVPGLPTYLAKKPQPAAPADAGGAGAADEEGNE